MRILRTAEGEKLKGAKIRKGWRRTVMPLKRWKEMGSTAQVEGCA